MKTVATALCMSTSLALAPAAEAQLSEAVAPRVVHTIEQLELQHAADEAARSILEDHSTKFPRMRRCVREFGKSAAAQGVKAILQQGLGAPIEDGPPKSICEGTAGTFFVDPPEDNSGGQRR
ncbi:hypothetical protein [Burkholderia ubonensis]|uniref:hypothetical protein n=1 Tax=Burkholderia ubonensis TaxID=101571 RepID=UPI0012FA27D3|nr:hypothetical protein [Burkholderia ubonensis]